MRSGTAQMLLTRLNEHRSGQLHVLSLSWPEAARRCAVQRASWLMVALKIKASRINKDLSPGESRQLDHVFFFQTLR